MSRYKKVLLKDRDPLKMRNKMKLQAVICLECIWKQITHTMKNISIYVCTVLTPSTPCHF